MYKKYLNAALHKNNIFLRLGFLSLILLFVSLIYFTLTNDNKNSFEYYSIQQNIWRDNNFQAHKEFLKKSKMSGNFIAKDDDLANISIPFNTNNRVNSDIVLFRIKEKEKNWYYQSAYSTTQLLKDIPYEFTIPVIKNSKNKAYYFEIESLKGNHGNAISVSNKNLFFLKYKLTKSDLTNISKLTRFITTNISIQVFSLSINEISISILLLFMPFILYEIVKYKPIILLILRLIIKYKYVLYPLLGVISLFYLIVHYGNIQFPGMDGSVLVNAAWQYHLGYIPYKDIITIAPPGFFLGSRIGFDIFGISWNSLLLFLAFFSIVTFLIQAVIFRKFGMNILMSYLASFFIQLITNVPTSMWWYNNITSVSAALFLSSTLLFYKNPKRLFNTLTFFFTTVLLCLMKPNIAGPLLAVTYVIFLFVKNLRIKSIAIGISAGFVTLCLLYMIGINPFDLFYAYTNGANRLDSAYILYRIPISADPLESYRTLIYSIPLIFTIFMLVGYVVFNKITHLVVKKYKVYMLFIIIGIAITVFGFGTNAELKMVDLPVTYVSILLFIIVLKTTINKQKTNSTLNLSKILLVMISFMLLMGNYAIFLTAQRERIQHQAFYQDLPVSSYANNETFFKNMSSTPWFFTTLDNMISLMDVVRKVDSDWNYKIYFGPRITFGYAMFGIKPVKGMPLWWGEGLGSGGVPRGMTKKLVNLFEKSDLKMVITLSGDLTFHPPEIQEYLTKFYVPYKIGYILVYINPHDENIVRAVSAIAEK